MDKKIAGLLGAAAALTTFTAANAAAPAQSNELAPASYRELLDPVPNATAALKADDARRSEAQTAETQVAQVFYHHHYHHHHHIIIRPPRRRFYHHHHHHHHHAHIYIR